MNRFSFALIAALVAVGPAMVAPQTTAQTEKQLAAAQHKATVDGDLKAAIEMYQKIVAGAGANRALAAQALVKMAECYQKLGDAESRRLYERVVRDFADQIESAATARARLGAITSDVRTLRQTARQVWTGAGANGTIYGSVSPDGRYLSFRSNDLAMRDLKDGTERRLTNDAAQTGGYTISSVISPDSKQVAYGWGSAKDRTIDLRVLPLTGAGATRPRILHRHEETAVVRPFAWTPDATQLLVLRTLKDRTNQIAMVSVQDGTLRVIKSLPWQYVEMSLSPDGRYIAYDAPAADGISARDIVVLAADGSRESKAVESPADDFFPVWSPDGSRLVFLSTRTGNGSLWTVPIYEGTPKGAAELVKADVGRIRPLGMTRSGALYYLIPGLLRTNVYVAPLDAAGKAAKTPTLITERFINSNGQPSWSPDGRRLAYLSARGTRASGPPPAVLVIRTLDTGDERDVPLQISLSGGNFCSLTAVVS